VVKASLVIQGTWLRVLPTLKTDKLEKENGSLEELLEITCTMEVKKKSKIGECTILKKDAPSTPTTKELFSFCKVT